MLLTWDSPWLCVLSNKTQTRTPSACMAPVHQVSSESACRFGLWSVALQTNRQTDRQTEKPDNKGYLTKRIPIAHDVLSISGEGQAIPNKNSDIPASASFKVQNRTTRWELSSSCTGKKKKERLDAYINWIISVGAEQKWTHLCKM